MKMMMMMLLLVSTVALLPSPAAGYPTHQWTDNLNRLLELADRFNASLVRQLFVEDVRKIGCGDVFFCKVHDILRKHENFTKRKDEEELVRNLKMYNQRENVNCTALLKDVMPTGVEIQIPTFMGSLKFCIQQTNFKPNP